ncbi:MAG: (2Fe-2S)-binding protein [Clostridia bacterium]|nr:(2Fe-2S)-binding protein [Clostridia bacterium]
MDPKTIICRCSDITLEEVRQAISDGYTTFDEIKRVLRTGMGSCQGRTCMPLILREISVMTGIPQEDLNPGRKRPPVNAVSLGAIAEGEDHDYES